MNTDNRETEQRPALDPATLSVVWNRLYDITNDIGEKVAFAAQSRVMANIRDLGSTMLSPKGEVLIQGQFSVGHTLASIVPLRHIINKFGDDFHPGDFIIANDPYKTSSGHLPDWTMVRPVFYRDELVGFFQFRGHQADTGGFMPGGYAPKAYDIIAEGLCIPPIKIVEKGVEQKVVAELIYNNVRNAPIVRMDTMLANGAMIRSEERLVALIDKYGLETVKTCLNEILLAGERATRAEIAKIPDGTYYGESAADWDGFTDKPVWVRVKVTVKGDEIIFDYSESDKQVTFINSPLGNTYSRTLLAFFLSIDPNIPHNGGSIRPITIIAPEGTVVNPVYPATVGACACIVGHELAESCLMALGKANPDMAMGAWSRHLMPSIQGRDPRFIDPRTGHIKEYSGGTFASDGGSGAVKGYDGWQGVGFYGNAGMMPRGEIEIFEANTPAHYLRYEVLPDYEGAGEFRGAPGTYTEFIVDTVEGAPCFTQTGNSDGEKFAPFGQAGGGSPPVSDMFIESKSGKRRVLRTFALEPLQPGDKIITKCQGGGGWGNPLDRHVEKVHDDVLDHYVSAQRARDVYGVIIDPETYEIDYQATKRLREEMREKA